MPVFVAIPSATSKVNMAPITGLSATSSMCPLLSARSSAASNNRLPKAGIRAEIIDRARPGERTGKQTMHEDDRNLVWIVRLEHEQVRVEILIIGMQERGQWRAPHPDRLPDQRGGQVAG